MTEVPDKVLSWLYSVLHEYQDPQRTYSDAARTLSGYPSLSPRTEVYTYENGASALLLTISGTIPVDFRGTIYRFPIKIWVPQAYPQESPIVYVTPGTDMVVRPGQHVGVDGRVYHPYLRDWSSMWDRASIAEFLDFLQQAFMREPPVVSRAQQQRFQGTFEQQQQQSPGASPAPPILPPKQRPGSVVSTVTPGGATPPPKPPKPGDEYTERTSSRSYARDGPPLPLLPGERPPSTHYAPSPRQGSNGYGVPPPNPQHQHTQYSNPSNGRPPPPLPHQVQGHPGPSNYDQSPVSPIVPPGAYGSQPAVPQQQRHPSYGRPTPQAPHPAQQNLPFRPSHQQQPPQSYPPFQQYPPHHPPGPQPQPKKQPPRDLLSDPFDVALPVSLPGSSAPAPPIPPNPEKEHLLQALSATLAQQAQQKVNQNLSAIAPLQAQQTALRAAHARLEAELAQLSSLDNLLASNESILRRNIQDCDHSIEAARAKKQPPIDEVLVAPTLVANQLWTLAAEEQAAKEAMYVLQKAVDRGRVSGSDFVRQMRGLGRESFLKMVLMRKCARGLGLVVDR